MAVALVSGCSGRAAGSERTVPQQTGAHGAASPVPDLPPSATLQAAALDEAERACDERRDVPRAGAGDRYDQETWAEVAEAVGRAPIPQPGDRGARRSARARVEAGWAAADALPAGDWDRSGAAEVVCGDGDLYVVVALARAPRKEDADLRRPRVPSDDIVVQTAIPYRRAVRVDGSDATLLLDVYAPPEARRTPRPAVVLVHGGGFAAGTRAMHTLDAVAYARRGLVAVTIDYRLDPDAGDSTRAHRAAWWAAVEDARAAVAWLRAHAARFDIDPDRIAALGASAGGEIALSLALLEDPDDGGDPDASRVSAAVSTGAYLTPLLGGARLDDTDAPVLLQYFESDTASGRPWTYAAATCEAVRAAGTTCDLVVSPGSDHTVGLGPWGAEADRILPFLAVHLDLGP